MEDEVFALYNVACHTIGCGNAEHTIIVSAATSSATEIPRVICGVCMVLITDVELTDINPI